MGRRDLIGQRHFSFYDKETEMKKIEIRGFGENCASISGDILQEFAIDEGWRFLHFSDGTIVRVGYGLLPDVGWDIRAIELGEKTSSVRKEPVLDTEYDVGSHYTDRLVLMGELGDYACCWKDAGRPDNVEIDDFFTYDFRPSEFSPLKLRGAYEALFPMACQKSEVGHTVSEKF